MDQTTTSTQVDDGSNGTADKPGTAHRTRRRAFLAMGAAAILATGAGAGAFASRSGPFAAKARPTTPTFSGATDTITKGDLQGQTSVSGTLRYSDSRKFKSGFEGVLIQVPASGAVLTQGDVLYRTGSEIAYLMHGSLPAWRTFEAGMENGEDIRQLETLLQGMGYFDYEPDNHFSWATTSAIMKWQKAVGLPQTGTIPLGRMVFTPGDLRVGTVTARVGDRIAADTELYDVTSTTQVVDANIKLSDQKLAVVGTAVTIKLPDASTTTGTITSVGTPTEKSSGSGSGSGSGSSDSKERVIPITVTLTDASATANFQEVSVTVDLPSEKREGVLSVPVGALLALSPDQYGVEIVAPDGTTRKVAVSVGLFAGGRVEVSVTVDLPSEKRTGVLSVPVGALLALSADQYGVEIVEAGGTTRKVPVTIGLFAGGRVEISGKDISEGQRVVVPQT